MRLRSGCAAGAAGAGRPGETRAGIAASAPYGSFQHHVDTMFQMLAVYEKAAATSPVVAHNLQGLRMRLQAAYLDCRPALPVAESQENLRRVRRIVQDLKDFSCADPLQAWARTDLNQLTETALHAVADEWQHRADVVKAYGVLPAVECLPSQVRQVLTNLIVNAAHALQPHHRGRIAVRTGSAGSKAWFEIEDNGCGIGRDALPRIFDPFYSSKPVRQGTGLGLSLAYGIVQAHHGRIDATSEPGRGTTFRVTLPVSRTAIEFTDTVPA